MRMMSPLMHSVNVRHTLLHVCKLSSLSYGDFTDLLSSVIHVQQIKPPLLKNKIAKIEYFTVYINSRLLCLSRPILHGAELLILINNACPF